MKTIISIVSVALIGVTFAQTGNYVPVGNISNLQQTTSIDCLESDENGELYIAGAFSDQGGNNYIGHFDGTNWEQLPNTNGLVSQHGIETMCLISSSNILVGGLLANNNGDYHVIQVTGASASVFGTTPFTGGPLSGEVTDICAAADGTIYVSGLFQNTNGDYFIAKYSNGVWSEAGGASAFHPNDWVLTMCMDNSGNLYVGGQYTNGAGLPFVKKFDGTNWSDLPNGTLPDQIHELRCDAAGNLYATGSFYNAQNHYYIAKYTASGFVELGGNDALKANDEIYDFEFDSQGNLFATGGFKNASNYNYVAKFNGNSWTQYGNDNMAFVSSFYSLEIDNADNLYIAGNVYDLNSMAINVFRFEAAAGIEETTSENVTVYPNPAGEQLFCKSLKQGESVAIYTTEGKLVLQTNYSIDGIAVSGLPAGSYRLMNASGDRIGNWVKNN